jgi:hypothetical protein
MTKIVKCNLIYKSKRNEKFEPITIGIINYKIFGEFERNDRKLSQENFFYVLHVSK